MSTIAAMATRAFNLVPRPMYQPDVQRRVDQQGNNNGVFEEKDLFDLFTRAAESPKIQALRAADESLDYAFNPRPAGGVDAYMLAHILVSIIFPLWWLVTLFVFIRIKSVEAEARQLSRLHAREVEVKAVAELVEAVQAQPSGSNATTATATSPSAAGIANANAVSVSNLLWDATAPKGDIIGVFFAYVTLGASAVLAPNTVLARGAGGIWDYEADELIEKANTRPAADRQMLALVLRRGLQTQTISTLGVDAAGANRALDKLNAFIAANPGATDAVTADAILYSNDVRTFGDDTLRTLRLGLDQLTTSLHRDPSLTEAQVQRMVAALDQVPSGQRQSLLKLISKDVPGRLPFGTLREWPARSTPALDRLKPMIG